MGKSEKSGCGQIFGLIRRIRCYEENSNIIIPNVIILYFKMDCLAQEEKRRKSELDLKKSVFLKLF